MPKEFTNSVTGTLTKIDMDDLLKRAMQVNGESTAHSVGSTIRQFEPSAVVVYEDQDLGLIARYGYSRTAFLVVGKKCSTPFLKAISAPIGNLPSNFRYPVAYCVIDEVAFAKETEHVCG